MNNTLLNLEGRMADKQVNTLKSFIKIPNRIDFKRYFRR